MRYDAILVFVALVVVSAAGAWACNALGLHEVDVKFIGAEAGAHDAASDAAHE